MADEGTSGYRNSLITKLKKRNQRENHAFAKFIATLLTDDDDLDVIELWRGQPRVDVYYNRLFDSIDAMRIRDIQYRLECEKLRNENLDLKVKIDTGGGGVPGEKTQALEQKIYRLQEELTELHRRKGENAQQIIDLNHSVQEKEKEIAILESRLNESEATNQALVQAHGGLETTILEQQATIQTLRDELQALQLAYTTMEDEIKKLKLENQSLVMRLIQQRAHDADILNAENDREFRRRQARIQEQLEEATRDDKPILPFGGVDGPMICTSSSVPTRAIQCFDAHEGEVMAVRFSPSGRMFATGGSDRKLKIWEPLTTGECVMRASLAGCNQSIMSVEFDTEETYVLAASNDFASRVWKVQDHRLRHTLTGHSARVLAAKFLGDCHKVVSGSHDRTLKIWDLRSAACTRTIFAGSSCFDLVAVDTLGTSIISGHFDRKIRFWDQRSDRSANEICLQGRITSLDISVDKNNLLCCTKDQDALKVIDLRMNQVVNTFCHDNFRVGVDSLRAVFSSDGQYVSAGATNGSVFVWNIRGKLEQTLKEHTHPVMAVSWSPTRSYIISVDKQRRAVLWT